MVLLFDSCAARLANLAKRVECGQLAGAFGHPPRPKAGASSTHSKRFARFGCGCRAGHRWLNPWTTFELECDVLMQTRERRREAGSAKRRAQGAYRLELSALRLDPVVPLESELKIHREWNRVWPDCGNLGRGIESWSECG